MQINTLDYFFSQEQASSHVHEKWNLVNIAIPEEKSMENSII